MNRTIRYVIHRLQRMLWSFGYIAYMLACVCLDVGNWWFISTSGFLVGMLAYKYKKQCLKLLDFRWCKMGIIVLLIVEVLVTLVASAVFYKVKETFSKQ